MFFLYSLLYTIGFAALVPFFAIKRGKYFPNFRERFGVLPECKRDGRPVIWIHCVSVGETNAARPLVDEIRARHPNYRIVISTITKTGRDLAKKVFAADADLVFYFPLDWKFTVRRALRAVRPDIVLIFETEIWLNFLREADVRGVTLVLVNGRLSEKSFSRYLWIRKTIRRVLRKLDLVIAQTSSDADRLKQLGVRSRKVNVCGNLKFDQTTQSDDRSLNAYFRERFGFSSSGPLIVLASTHDPEEKWLLQAFSSLIKTDEGKNARLLIAPRHPERFEDIAKEIDATGLSWTRRTSHLDIEDEEAQIVLLDSIGELRSVYAFAEIVFVGGSLVPHGGQNILEPALDKRAIVTGSYMMNFDAITGEFVDNEAILQIPPALEQEIPALLTRAFSVLLSDEEFRTSMGERAFEVFEKNKGVSKRTVDLLDPILKVLDNNFLSNSASPVTE